MDQIPRTRQAMMIAGTLMLLAAIVCSRAPDMRDQRLAEFARQSTEQQAKQNDAMAQQSKAVVEESSQADVIETIVRHRGLCQAG